MNIRFTAPLILMLAGCAHAATEERYTIKENLHPGVKISVEMTSETHVRISMKNPAKPVEQPQTTDGVVKQSGKWLVTVVETKDGSATAMRIDMDAGSTTSTQTAGAAEAKEPFELAGKSFTIKRQADGSVSHDLKEKLQADTVDFATNLLQVGAECYPDHPVAVGETWDVSDALAHFVGLEKGDKLKVKCRLDWVKAINGNQIAHITASCVSVRHQENNREINDGVQMTMMVNLAAGIIVGFDGKGKTINTSAINDPTQYTNTSEYSAHETWSVVTEKPAEPSK